MNYKIIQNEQSLQDFINWLPELQKGECYMLLLFSRKKYVPELGLTSDKGQLSRKVCTSKDRIIQKIRQMEVKIGDYLHDDKPVPQESLALYITINPRSMYRAGKNLCKNLMEKIFGEDKGFNPASLALSEIQSACSRKEYFIFDIDNKISFQELCKLQMTIKNAIGEAADIIETRGGYHLLIKLDTIEQSKKKTWYNEIKKIPNIDQSGDLISPVIGCYQGGFIPEFI